MHRSLRSLQQWLAHPCCHPHHSGNGVLQTHHTGLAWAAALVQLEEVRNKPVGVRFVLPRPRWVPEKQRSIQSSLTKYLIVLKYITLFKFGLNIVLLQYYQYWYSSSILFVHTRTSRRLLYWLINLHYIWSNFGVHFSIMYYIVFRLMVTGSKQWTCTN